MGGSITESSSTTEWYKTVFFKILTVIVCGLYIWREFEMSEQLMTKKILELQTRKQRIDSNKQKKILNYTTYASIGFITVICLLILFERFKFECNIATVILLLFIIIREFSLFWYLYQLTMTTKNTLLTVWSFVNVIIIGFLLLEFFIEQRC